MAIFSFEIQKEHMTHLKEKSHYNNNYYQLNFSSYGDYFGVCRCNILHEVFDEFSETYTYALGFFENGNFNSMFEWTEFECKTT